MSKKNMSRKTLVKILDALGVDYRRMNAVEWYFDYDTRTLHYKELELDENGEPIYLECGHCLKERDAIIKLDATRFYPGEALSITKKLERIEFALGSLDLS